MRIDCPCGAKIRDQTDNLPHKGHLILDQDWFAVFDAIDDEVIIPISDGRIDPVRAQTLARVIISRPARMMYECQECGRLYIDGPDRGCRVYLPADERSPRGILRGERTVNESPG